MKWNINEKSNLKKIEKEIIHVLSSDEIYSETFRSAVRRNDNSSSIPSIQSVHNSGEISIDNNNGGIAARPSERLNIDKALTAKETTGGTN